MVFVVETDTQTVTMVCSVVTKEAMASGLERVSPPRRGDCRFLKEVTSVLN